jgi:hypothetical protein
VIEPPTPCQTPAQGASLAQVRLVRAVRKRSGSEMPPRSSLSFWLQSLFPRVRCSVAACPPCNTFLLLQNVLAAQKRKTVSNIGKIIGRPFHCGGLAPASLDEAVGSTWASMSTGWKCTLKCEAAVLLAACLQHLTSEKRWKKAHNTCPNDRHPKCFAFQGPAEFACFF